MPEPEVPPEVPPVQNTLFDTSEIYLPALRPVRWRVEWRWKKTDLLPDRDSKTWFVHHGSLHYTLTTERQGINDCARLRRAFRGKSYRTVVAQFKQDGIHHYPECGDLCTEGLTSGIVRDQCKCHCHVYVHGILYQTPGSDCTINGCTLYPPVTPPVNLPIPATD